jgi:DNA repair protein RadC
MAKQPHYIGHRKRLRNRFMQQSLESLYDYEVIEILLTFVIPQRDVKLSRGILHLGN